MMQTRISWIDIAKGYGILFVIIAHLPSGIVAKELYTFHIPLFFFLSGIVFSADKYRFHEFIIKKFKLYIFPYFSLGIPMILFTFYLNRSDLNIQQILEVNKNFLIQTRMWTIWFIACLFWLNVLFYWLVRVSHNNTKRLLFISLISVCFGLVYYRIGGKPLPWNIDVCFMALPFFCGGYLLKKQLIQNWAFSNTKILLILPFFVVINLMSAYGSYKLSGSNLEMFRSSYGNPLFTYLAAFTGIIATVLFSKQFQLSWLEYIGKHSLVYFAWHQTIMIPSLDIIYKKLNLFQSHNVATKICYLLVSTFLILGILTAADYVIRHTKLRFMVGEFEWSPTQAQNSATSSDKNT